jgi:hypothetical protein
VQPKQKITPKLQVSFGSGSLPKGKPKETGNDPEPNECGEVYCQVHWKRKGIEVRHFCLLCNKLFVCVLFVVVF